MTKLCNSVKRNVCTCAPRYFFKDIHGNGIFISRWFGGGRKQPKCFLIEKWTHVINTKGGVLTAMLKDNGSHISRFPEESLKQVSEHRSQDHWTPPQTLKVYKGEMNFMRRTFAVDHWSHEADHTPREESPTSQPQTYPDRGGSE